MYIAPYWLREEGAVWVLVIPYMLHDGDVAARAQKCVAEVLKLIQMKDEWKFVKIQGETVSERLKE